MIDPLKDFEAGFGVDSETEERDVVVDTGGLTDGFEWMTPEEEAQAADNLAFQGYAGPVIGTPDLAFAGSMVPYDFGSSEYDKEVTLPEQMVDLEEHRALSQGLSEKLQYGAIKFAGKTGVNVVGSIAGLAWGLIQMGAQKDESAFWNNDFSHWLDSLNESMDRNLPHHVTRLEKEKGFWDTMGTANFWSDTFLNGMSFLAGAAISEVLASATLGPLGASLNASRLLKGLNMKHVLAGLGKASTKKAAKEALKAGTRGSMLKHSAVVLRQSLTGAGYEAGVESRSAYTAMKDEFINQALGDELIAAEEEAGRALTSEEKYNMLSPEKRQEIENRSTKMSNWIFAGNFALVGYSNILMLPKLYGRSIKHSILSLPGNAGRKAMQWAGRNTGVRGLPTANSLFEKGATKVFGRYGEKVADAARIGKRVIGTGLYEGVVEEGGQGAMQRATYDYALLSGLREEYSMDMVGATLRSIGEGIHGSAFSKDGQLEIAVGFILGALGLPGTNMTAVSAYKEVKQRRAVVDRINALTEKHPNLLNSLRQNHTFFSNVIKRSELMDEALQNGDVGLAKDLEFDDFFDYTMAKLNTGQFKDIDNDLKMIAALDAAAFREVGGYTELELPDDQVSERRAQVVKAVRERADKIQEAMEVVDGYTRMTPAQKILHEDRIMSPGYLRRQLTHLLSVMDDSDARERSMIGEMAEDTNGVIREVKDQVDQIEYTDKDGKKRTVDVGAFTETAKVEDYIVKLTEAVEMMENSDELSDEQEETLKTYKNTLAQLEGVRSNYGAEARLSPEEYNKILKPALELEEWKKLDPEGAAKKEKKVVQLLNDIRRIRTRRQAAAESFRLLLDEEYRQGELNKLKEAYDTQIEKDKADRKNEEESRTESVKDQLKTKAENDEAEAELKAKVAKAKKAKLKQISDIDTKVAEFQDEVERLTTELIPLLNTKPNAKGRIILRDANGKILTNTTPAKLKEMINELTEFIEDYEEQAELLRSDRLNVQEGLAVLEMINERGMLFDNMLDIVNTDVMEALKGTPLESVMDTEVAVMEGLRDIDTHREIFGAKLEALTEAEIEVEGRISNLKTYRGQLWKLLNAFVNDDTSFDATDADWLGSELDINEKQLADLQRSLRAIRGLKVKAGTNFKNIDTIKVAYVAFEAWEHVINQSLDDKEKVEAKKTASEKSSVAEDATEDAELDHITDQAKRKKKKGRRPYDYKLPDIQNPGFYKTTGWHASEREDIEGPLETYNRYAELFEEDSKHVLKDDESREFENAKSQLRWFTYLQGGKEWIKFEGTKEFEEIQGGEPFGSVVKPKKDDPDVDNSSDKLGLRVVLIHSGNIPEELKDEGITKDMFMDTAEHKDIKAFLFREHHTSYTSEKVKGNRGQWKWERVKKITPVNDFVRVSEDEEGKGKSFVYTSLMLPTLKKNKAGDPYSRFIVPPGVDEELIREEWASFRKSIVENEDGTPRLDQLLFKVNGKHLGTILLEGGEQPSQNLGRVTDSSSAYKDTLLMVAKGSEEEAEDEADTVSLIPYNNLPGMMLRAGMIAAYDDVRHMMIPMHSRLLDSSEAENIVRMMHLLLQEKALRAANVAVYKNTAKAWESIKKGFTVPVDGTEINVWDTLNQMVYIGSKKRKDPAYRLSHDKRGFTFGAEGTSINLETFTVESEENTKKIEAMKAFLLTKYHQVDHDALKNSVTQSTNNGYVRPKWYMTKKTKSSESKYPWGEIHLDADLSVSDTSVLYNNYNEYLLKDRKGDKQSPLRTRVKPIANLGELNAPRVLGGYFTFAKEDHITLAGIKRGGPGGAGPRLGGVRKGADPTSGSTADGDSIFKKAPSRGAEDAIQSDDEVTDEAMDRMQKRKENRTDEEKERLKNVFKKKKKKKSDDDTSDDVPWEDIPDTENTKASLSVKPTQQSSEVDLGTETAPKGGKVVIDTVKGKKPQAGAVVAFRTEGKTEQNMIDALEDNAVGNPFGPYGAIKEKTVVSVTRFLDWLEGKGDKNVMQDYRNALLAKVPELKGKTIYYYKDLGRPSHATALDYFLNKPTQQSSSKDSVADKKDTDPFSGPAPLLLEVGKELGEGYMKETYAEELKRAQGMSSAEIVEVIGTIPFMGKDAIGLIDGLGRILISKGLAVGGTLYHETFHNVSLFFLSPYESGNMYNLVRRIPGSTTTYLGKEKKMSKLTDKEAEEWLAEEFRRYVLWEGEYKLGQDTVEDDRSRLKKFFDSILNWFRARFGMTRGLEISPEMGGIKDLFSKIVKGEMYESLPDPKRDWTERTAMLRSMILGEESATYSKDLMSTMSAYVADVITDPNTNISFEELLNFTVSTSSDMGKRIGKVYKEAYQRMWIGYRNAYNEADAAGRGDLLRRSMIIWPEKDGAKPIEGVARRNEISRLHRAYMHQLGLTIEAEDDKDENGRRTKDWKEDSESLEVSPTERASRRIRILLATIPNKTVRNSTGLHGVYELRDTLKTLQDKLAGKLNYLDQLNTMKALAPEFPWMEDVAARLGSYATTGEEALETMLLRTQFRGQFGQTMMEVRQTLLSENGRIGSLDPSMERAQRSIKNEWNSNLRRMAVLVNEGHVSFTPNGSIQFAAEGAFPVGKKNDMITFDDLRKKVTGSKNLDLVMDGLEKFGINFTNREEIKDNANKIIDNETYSSSLRDALMHAINDVLKNNFEVSGGHEAKGKETIQGDGKDKAMRKVADGFIGEMDRTPRVEPRKYKSFSSIGTSWRVFGLKNNAAGAGGNLGNTVEAWRPTNKIIMLARDDKLKGTDISAVTKERIAIAMAKGAKFVVGDMPGVDSQFIEYLTQIGAKFTVYHTGKDSRIPRARVGIKASLFDRSVAKSVTRMNRLAKIERATGTREFEFQFQNAEGKLEYSITLNMYITILENMSKKELSTYYDSANNPFGENSLALASWDKRKSFSVVNMAGIQVDAPGQTGSKMPGLKMSDIVVNHVQAIMDGISISPRAADQQTEFGVKFNIEHGKTIKDVEDLMYDYLEDEIAAGVKGNTEGQFLEDFNKKTQGLRKFSALVGKDMEAKIVKELIDDPAVYNEIIRKDPSRRRMKINAFLDNNWNEIWSSITENLQATVKENIEFFEEQGLIGKKDQRNSRALFGLNREYFKNKPEDTLPDTVLEEEIEGFAEEFTVTQFIQNTEYYKVILGDPALYKALFKRVKGTYGTKKLMDVDPMYNNWLSANSLGMSRTDGFIDMILAKEPIDFTRLIDKYPPALQPAYRKAIDKADGTLLVTLEDYRQYGLRVGSWLPEQDKAFHQILAYRRGERTTLPEIKLGAFPPAKYQYFGPQKWAKGKIQPMGFLKMSVVPVYPEAGIEYPGLQSLFDIMKDNNVGGIVIPTAFKVGLTTEDAQVELFNADGTIDPKPLVKEEMKTTFDLRFMGEQLEVAPKFKGTSPISTQARVQVLSDLFEDGKLLHGSLRANIKEYHALLNGLTDKAFGDLLDEFNIEEVDGQYNIRNNDYTRFIDALKEEGIRRDLSQALLDGMDGLQESNDLKEPVLFDLLVNKRRMEGLLWSLAGKRVIRQRFHGDMYVQKSNLGYEVVQQKFGDSVINQMEPLKFYMEGGEMEVYLPHHFKELIGKGARVGKDGAIYIDGQKEAVGSKNLLRLMGIRIPADGTHSIEVIRVKAFLPRSQGPTIVVPSELLTKSGSDFDIDKLVLYFPSYKVEVKENGVKKLVKERFHKDLQTWYKIAKAEAEESLGEIEGILRRSRGVEELDDTVANEIAQRFVDRVFGPEDKLRDDPELEGLFEKDDDMEHIASVIKKSPKIARKILEQRKKDFEALKNNYSEWRAANPDATEYVVNSKGAIQNRIMDMMVKMLENRNRQQTFLQPTHMEQWKTLGKEMLEKGNLTDLGDVTDYYHANSFKHLMAVSEAFWQAGTVVSITALASTHHVKSQMAGLKLNLRTLKTKSNGESEMVENSFKAPTGQNLKYQIRFNRFNNDQDQISLGRINDVNQAYTDPNSPHYDPAAVSYRISDAISQLVQAAVDAVNEPLLHLINMGPDVAPTGLFLLRAGVPMSSMTYFLNQPIIKEYLHEYGVKTSRMMKVLEVEGNREAILKKIRRSYLVKNRSETDYYFIDKDDQNLPEDQRVGLYDMVGMHKTEMGKAQKEAQLQILNDFLLYEHLGEDLSAMTTAQSFDTKPPKSRNGLRLALANYERVINGKTFSNAKQITEGDTFLKSMTGYNRTMQGVLNSVFLTEQAGEAYNEGFRDMVDIFTDPRKRWLSEDDRVRILNQYEEGFVSFLIQRVSLNGKPKIGNDATRLLYGNNTMAIRLNKIRNSEDNEKLRLNPFIQALVPVVAAETLNEQNDYIEPLFRTMNNPEQTTLFDGFREIERDDPLLARDIILTAFLQSGIGQTPQSFLELIPGSSFMEVAKDILHEYVNDPEIIEVAAEDYFEEFFKNNTHDIRIVPIENSTFTASKKNRKKGPNDKKRLLFPYTQRQTAESASARTLARKEGIALPKKETVLFKNVYYSLDNDVSNLKPSAVESTVVEESAMIGKRSRTHLNMMDGVVIQRRLPTLNEDEANDPTECNS